MMRRVLFHPSLLREGSVARHAAKPQIFIQQQRFFGSSEEDIVSALSPGRKKLFTVLNEYRKTNYTQTLPSRFLKEVLAATDSNKDGLITVEELEQLLNRINASDKMSQDDLNDIFAELGVDNATADHEKAIPVKTIVAQWKPLMQSPPKS
eukprot:scaffold2617_cov42-Attheya_sp.AAC.3